ncbi:MAG: chromosomal replication initiator DnaA [Pseudolabrys sp.]|jgi:chromosomal replication initiation ATPase DnaA
MGSMVSPRQLALALDHAESFAREDFLSGPPNEAALALIDRWPDWPDRMVVLVGPEGSGKSHLASIWASEVGARALSAHSLTHINLPLALATGALVVDDVAPESVDERALFHLLNLAREERASLLLTARSVPAAWTLEIRDLSSRLRVLPVVSVAPPDDALLRSLIVKLAADRQLQVDEGLVSFITARIERSFAGARAAVTRLDHEAMRQQRPVTRALAAELLR